MCCACRYFFFFPQPPTSPLRGLSPSLCLPLSVSPSISLLLGQDPSNKTPCTSRLCGESQPHWSSQFRVKVKEKEGTRTYPDTYASWVAHQISFFFIAKSFLCGLGIQSRGVPPQKRDEVAGEVESKASSLHNRSASSH